MSPTEFEREKRTAAVSWGVGTVLATTAVGMTGGASLLVGAVAAALAYSEDPEK